ncbi:hypothetical protein EYF80_060973 [Liparis tanakae]|uniref:Secreted protein n=1 Tax=Liparis tanakae TaxID=230148 RepID=A0A4Z2EJA2_9TELE|nr:hypothetical protein EYF80_060973 [Liparis tanakae]
MNPTPLLSLCSPLLAVLRRSAAPPVHCNSTTHSQTLECSLVQMPALLKISGDLMLRFIF